MEELQSLLSEILDVNFICAVLSNPRTKEGIIKVKARPVELKGNQMIQREAFTKTQAFHENLKKEEAVLRLCNDMENFRQMQITAVGMEYTVLVSKKGRMTIRKHSAKACVSPASLSHNRHKQYILEEGMQIPFLQDLGVMTGEGRIVQSKSAKFRQVNRFLEFIEDILPRLDGGREITIVDFGCGKSYLTFAMYYYLHERKGYDVHIIGLDLKEDVIKHCVALAEKYGYEKLDFLVGDIARYDGVEQVDMVVALHACDTATDYALAKAVKWKAKVILSVPCCQHELNAQISNEILSPIMEYGLLKERFAALLTDGLRAKYLEGAGYEVQILEFIDMEHTPKNILIRAVQTGRCSHKSMEQVKKCEDFLQGELTLGRLL